MVSNNDKVIVAEKPSVARDLAQVVQANQRGEGYFYGNGHTVTWAVGHLVTLAEPHQMNGLWKAWSLEQLPMLPQEWPLVVVEKTQNQYEIVARLLREASEIICATDAGREGELIFRTIYEAARCEAPVKRLWISSLTPDAIQAGLRQIKPASEFDGLANAARGRSRADWLVGMNLSRAYALKTKEPFFVGRVQTPTLAMIVERDLKILNFVPENYLVIEGDFSFNNCNFSGCYIGERAHLEKPLTAKEKRLPACSEKSSGANSEEIDELLNRMRLASAKVELLEGKTASQKPPLLYDLTELQRHCNRLYGLAAAQSLSIAQNLYEQHKLISYPRTDSRHLSTAVAATLTQIVPMVAKPYGALLDPATGQGSLDKRYIDDSKVTDHHAIIPTPVVAKVEKLSDLERKVYDLICRRLLMAWQPDYQTKITTVITAVGEQDLFKSQGTLVVKKGWKSLEIQTRAEAKEDLLPSDLRLHSEVSVLSIDSKKKKTEPPPHLTEATLLTGMETAGRNLEDRELADAIRDSGIGTPATRAGIIETLLSRGYIERQGKSLRSTLLGQRLIERVHPSVKSPELTARWEQKLSEIKTGKIQLKDFLKSLEEEIAQRVLEIKATRIIPVPQVAAPAAVSTETLTDPSCPVASMQRQPARPKELSEILRSQFGFEKFRENQEQVCQAVIEGKDVLLVMPTGAGKSICFQVPGLARGGTTLVVSPLVALIEDQVLKLQALNLSAERIHSGRSRAESRAVCQRYLAGELDFLFIAPERLSVPGFPEFLRRRPPSLIAIDEAHCISQWGHDFRPDYRLLGERLGDFRPTPIIALTATATPRVQDDICQQLGLRGDQRYIQGFRRNNIAIEVAEQPPPERSSTIMALLKKSDNLPAIVYAPTRKKAEELTTFLRRSLRVETYHAGLLNNERDRVQARFLASEIDVIVATIAFGMGIDKANIRTVIHAALPGSVEGYYQEIGRAGRDGLPSKAILLYSYADMKTHEFFFEKNYPPPEDLQLILDSSRRSKLKDKSEIQRHLRLDDDDFEQSLNQLITHRAITVDSDGMVTICPIDWERSYRTQREQKQKQLRQINSFTQSGKCRMVFLVSHFGDQRDSGKPCGLCDHCQPHQQDRLIQKSQISQNQLQTVADLVATLKRDGPQAAGRLFESLTLSHSKLLRSEFERLLAALEQARWIETKEVTFEKGDQTISYRKVALTSAGLRCTSIELSALQITGSAVSGGKKKRPRKKSKRSGFKYRKRHDNSSYR